MYKILNFIMIIFIICFFFIIYKYYFSKNNLNNKNFNRSNINQILKEKIANIPVLQSDTSNVIEFNNSLDNELNNNKKRNFWDLLKSK